MALINQSFLSLVVSSLTCDLKSGPSAINSPLKASPADTVTVSKEKVDFTPSKASTNERYEPTVGTTPPLAPPIDVQNREANKPRFQVVVRRKQPTQKPQQQQQQQVVTSPQPKIEPIEQERVEPNEGQAAVNEGSDLENEQQSADSGNSTSDDNDDDSNDDASGQSDADDDAKDDAGDSASADDDSGTNVEAGSESDAVAADDCPERMREMIAAKMSEGLLSFTQTGDIKYLLALFRYFLAATDEKSSDEDKYVHVR